MKPSLPYSKIIRVYWNAMKKYPLSGIGLFLIYALGFLLADVILLLFYRDLLDLIASATPSPKIWEQILKFMIYIGGIYVAFNVLFRVGDFMIVYHQTQVIRELENKAFESFQKRSYEFFASNFTGALVAKARRFSGAFERIHDELTFQLWMNAVLITGIFIALLFTLKPVAFFFLGWTVFYVLITLIFVRLRKPYDLSEAGEDSKVTAQLSDTLTNIVNVKLFTSRTKETERFEQATYNQQQAKSKAWNINNIYLALILNG